MVAFVAIVFPLLAALSLAAAAALPSQPPVIIVPGTTGSLLELKLSDPISPFPWCHKNTTWQVAYPLPQNAFANPTELACIENDLVPRFNSGAFACFCTLMWGFGLIFAAVLGCNTLLLCFSVSLVLSLWLCFATLSLSVSQLALSALRFFNSPTSFLLHKPHLISPCD
eukprot:m.16184 g.16184  ORF g.16184 m.16184 type:complete len:169 (-) comp5175_c0_seq1:1051-1557(-)